MREIKFRGKAMDNSVDGLPPDEWVTGSLVYEGKQPFILGKVVESDEQFINFEYWVPVFPESVGQYTGLKDMKGKEIYEGDIFIDSSIVQFYTVIWQNEGFRVEADGTILTFDDVFVDGRCEVVGNVWENPELLELP